MSKVLITKDKVDLLANAIASKSGESVPMTLDEMVAAVDGIEAGGGGEPNLQAKTYTVDSTGTATITPDSGYDGMSSVEVSVPQADPYVADECGYSGTASNYKWSITPRVEVSVADGDTEGWIADGFSKYGETRTFNAVQANTSVTPTESSQTIGGKDYMMASAVTVNAIPSNYVGSGITSRSSSDLMESGATVTAPAGYYASQATKSVASGTAGTPTATKGTVSNHSISVTPSVTNTTGYITGSTKTGTAVSVSASELVSGNLPITDNGTGIDVSNYATVSVNVEAQSTTHTATVIKSGIDNEMQQMHCLVTYNKTKYYTKGDTFTFNAGDTLKITIQTYLSGARIVMENGVVLDSTTGGFYTYNYTLPDYDIEITLEQQWVSERGVVNISKASETYQLIASQNYAVNTTSSTSISVGTLQTGDTSIWTSDKMVYIKIRDNNGPRADYFYGCDCFLYNFAPHYGSTATQTYTLCGNMYKANSSGYVTSPIAIVRSSNSSVATGYGVYPTKIYSNGDVDIAARFSSSSSMPTGTINGNFSVDVYLLEWAGGIPPFNG